MDQEKIDKLATKDDLKEAASKLASKDELKEAVSKLATKDEFNKLVDKVDDLSHKVSVLHADAVAKNEKDAEVREILNALQEGVSDLLTGMDGLAKEHKEQRSEFVSNIAAHDRFESRITKLEQYPAVA